MAFPSNIPDADPDPTTQMPWPASRRLQRDAMHDSPAVESPQTERPAAIGSAKPTDDMLQPGQRKLSTLDLIYLSVSMGGAQIAWTVELGYVS
jgi:solute carrier family 45, member 1/2/4